jgi:type I restriction enzyme S subunit
LKFLLEYERPAIYRIAIGGGSTFPNVGGRQLNEYLAAFPPIPQQHSIAQALKAIEKAGSARRQELELERERKAALMQHLFTHGTRGERTKQTEIGEMPESWRAVKFAEAAEITKGQVNPTQEPYKSMPHVGPENIEQGTGRLLPAKTNEELKISSGNYLFTKNDVLYSKIRPYLNKKVALPSFDGTCSADMYPVRPRDGYMTREFLFHQLLSEQFRRQAMSFQSRTGIPKINREQLGSISLFAPTLDEQLEIASALGTCDNKIAALEQEAESLDELFRAMLEELMTGRLSTQPLIEPE